MSLGDAFAPALARYKAEIVAETWGHLAPRPKKIYTGFLVFTHGEYGDYTPIKARFKNLEDSPWFFDDMMDFIEKKAKKAGRVYRFEGTYRLLKNGHGRFTGKVTQIAIKGEI